MTFLPSVATVQQPCTSDARQVVNELYRNKLERATVAGGNTWVMDVDTVRELVRALATSEEHQQRFWREEPRADPGWGHC